MDKFMEWLSQQSTWKGLTVIASIFGVILLPEHQEKVMLVAGAIYSFIAMFVDKS